MSPLLLILISLASFASSLGALLVCQGFGLNFLYAVANESSIKMPKTLIEGVVLYIYGCIAAPLIEELIFRKLIFFVLFLFGLPVNWVVAIGAVLFSIAHRTERWQLPVPQLLGGLILGVTYIMFGFWPAVLIHSLHNFLSFTLAITLELNKKTEE